MTLESIEFKRNVFSAQHEFSILSKAFIDGACRIESVTTKDAQNNKELLKRMTVDLPASSVTAIMGPSGSGKSLLLSVLSRNIPSTVTAVGNISMSGQLAIVPQDDRLQGFFTVRSYMQHYARLTGISSDPATAGLIDDILTKLGLVEHVNTIVGDVFFNGLSGGQKRRLSVALEALTQPEIFILDEPTSGLDAESALKVMEFLKEYVRAAAGRYVIVTIHQPSTFIWEAIDHVVLLSQGHLVYNGPRRLMEDFFESVGSPTPAEWNPADHYVTVVNHEFGSSTLRPEEWASEYARWRRTYGSTKKAHQGRTTSMITTLEKSSKNVRRSNNPLVVGRELTYRNLLNLFFNPGILGTRIVIYSCLALMIGALFFNIGHKTDYESIQARTMILQYCTGFVAALSGAALPFTLMERAVVDKEVLNKYYPPYLYHLSLALSSLLGTGILALVTTLAVVTMTKLNSPYWFLLNMFLVLSISEALVHLASYMVSHFIIGIAGLAAVYGVFMLLEGYYLVPSHFPHWLRWTYNIAFHTYSWRSMMVSEFRDSGTNFTGSSFVTGQDVLAFYEIQNVNRGHDMVVLTGYYLVVNLFSLLALYVRYHCFRNTLKPIPTMGNDTKQQEQEQPQEELCEDLNE